MKLPIYLDYSSTTPLDVRVAKKMMEFLTIDGVFGNPSSSSHKFGWQAEEAVNLARSQVSNLINASNREIIFTSGATESINLAIKGIAGVYGNKKKHIITCKTEHKAVLNTCRWLELRGFDVTYLPTRKNGTIDLNVLKESIRNDTLLVSIMHVNNEIGIIHDIESVSRICSVSNTILHLDAAQSFGKIPIDVSKLSVDLMSFSGHKIYGPKGIGGLYIRRESCIRLEPQMHGGGHEFGIRSGTLAVHQIVGLGEACYIAKKELTSEFSRLSKLRDQLWSILKYIDGIHLNGDLKQGVPNILNISFDGIDSESLIVALKDLAISSGSACITSNLEGSHVLRTIGVNSKLINGAVRISFGRFTTEEEIKYAANLIYKIVNCLR